MKRAVVVGAGAGGCMAARDLSKHFDVTLIEAGGDFKPFSMNLDRMEPLRQRGLLFDERMIHALFPHMRILKARGAGSLVHVDGNGVGGTTQLATGNALRYDRYLKDVGANLDREFQELSYIVPTTTDHRGRWSELTERLYQVFVDQGLNPIVTPKFMEDAHRCVACGHCVLGCPYGAKWTADRLLEGCENVTLMKRAEVVRLAQKDGRVYGVELREPGKGSAAGALGLRKRVVEADVVVLAAGGINTPVILERAGIPVQQTFFDDLVLCVAANWPGANLDRQLPMPFVSDQDQYILSPYFDWLSFYFNKAWRAPSSDIMSIMIKTADDSVGGMVNGKLEKPITDHDFEVLAGAVDQVKGILRAVGVADEDMFLGTLNAGHPGGQLPITEAEAESFHHSVLPENVFVADATLFPRSMGNPPIMTIMAMAKRVASTCTERFA